MVLASQLNGQPGLYVIASSTQFIRRIVGKIHFVWLNKVQHVFL